MLSICLLLCALSLAGWARSKWVGDEVRYTTLRDGAPDERWALAQGGGDLVIVRAAAYGYPLESGWDYQTHPAGPMRNNLPFHVTGFFGYGVCHYRPTGAEAWQRIVRYDAVTLPYWLLVLLTASPWLIVGWRRWRHRAARRIAAGLCPACGYDLRASPGRCPECGASMTTAPRLAPSPGVA